MDFGAFAGGLSHGMDQGMRIGKNIRDLIKEGKLQDLREKGMAEAEAQRQKAVDESISEQKGEVPAEGAPAPATPATVAAQGAAPLPAPPVDPAVAASPTASPDQAGAATASQSLAPAMPPSVSTQTPAAPAAPSANEGNAGEAEAKAAGAAPAPGPASPTPQQAVSAKGVGGPGFYVGGQRFDTREQARAAAGKSAPSASDMFMKNAVPKIAAEYLAQGDPAKAKAWEDYAESQNGKRAMKDWASAYTAPDMDTAVAKFGKYYTDHINDGVDYTGHKLLTKADGTQVAVVTLKDKNTGKSTEMELTRQTMLQMGGANNPQKLFENAQAEQAAASKMGAERAIKREDRAYNRDTELIKREASDKREATRLAAQAERDAARDERTAVREDKRGEQRANEIELKARLDAENQRKYKATTDPIERRAIIHSDAMKNDTKYQRMTTEERTIYLDKSLESIQGKPAKEEPVKDAEKAPAKPAAMIETKPMPFSKDLPIKYRKSDNAPFHLVGGKYVPIEGGVVPKPQAPAPAGAVSQGMPPMMKPKMP